MPFQRDLTAAFFCVVQLAQGGFKCIKKLVAERIAAVCGGRCGLLCVGLDVPEPNVCVLGTRCEDEWFTCTLGCSEYQAFDPVFVACK